MVKLCKVCGMRLEMHDTSALRHCKQTMIDRALEANQQRERQRERAELEAELVIAPPGATR
jgi:transcription elongation factor Elf1